MALKIKLNPRGGLGIHIVKAIEAKHILGEVYCDWRGQHSFYKIPVGENFYDWVFEPQEKKAQVYEDIPNIAHKVTSPTVGWSYLHPAWDKHRVELNSIWLRDFKVRAEVLAKVTNTKGMVGAIYRTEKLIEQDQIMKGVPPKEQFADVVEAEAGDKDIWICAHAQESVDYFKQRWGTRVHFSDLEARTEVKGAMHLGKGEEHTQNALAEIITLAGCDKLVSCVSNMATTALLINPHMKHKFIQWGWDFNKPKNK